ERHGARRRQGPERRRRAGSAPRRRAGPGAPGWRSPHRGGIPRQPDAEPQPVRLRAEHLWRVAAHPADHRRRLPPGPPPVPDHPPVPLGAGGLRHFRPGPLAGAARSGTGAGDPAR
ncbi:MAG: hypothetical protein AVDCRST_MAG43-1315, partial [uncultured Thermomicrobiales bacterium]